MGRGRAKTKQTKVARQLKYSSPTMDLDALQRELGSAAPRNEAEDEYDEYADRYAADDDEDEGPRGRSR
jgi:hypothetical protein